MSALWWLIFSVLTGVFVALALTMPPGWGRWGRVVISLPLLALAMQPMVLAVFFIVALGYLWGGAIAHLVAGGITNSLYGRGSQSAGHTPDFKYARAAALDGDFKEAIKLAEWELSKQPDNYEGLVLMATIYMESSRPKLALEQLDRIVASPQATDEQRRLAAQARLECLSTIR